MQQMRQFYASAEYYFDAYMPLYAFLFSGVMPHNVLLSLFAIWAFADFCFMPISSSMLTL